MDRIIEILVATITNHNIALAYILVCPLIAISTNVKMQDRCCCYLCSYPNSNH